MITTSAGDKRDGASRRARGRVAAHGDDGLMSTRADERLQGPCAVVSDAYVAAQFTMGWSRNNGSGNAGTDAIVTACHRELLLLSPSATHDAAV